MKKKKMQLINVGICFIISASLLVGCSGEEELLPFSDGTESDAHSGLEESTSETVGMDASADKAQIVVYLCGAVCKPGVYTLAEGSRIHDAVALAGGFTEDAAQNHVNLAAKLSDADMIYIPTEKEMQQESTARQKGENLININTADVRELCSLPGIGESKAGDIITYREKNGPFQKKEDIMKVSGIKSSLYEKVESMISVK